MSFLRSYDLEMADWNAAAVLQPYPKTSPAFALLTIWARGIANGRLHRAAHRSCFQIVTTAAAL